MNLKTAGIALAAGALLTTSAFATATKQMQRELRRQDAAAAQQKEPGELAPTGRGFPNPQSNPHGDAGKPGGGGGNGIFYNGGPVMVNGATVHYIWYGDWTGAVGTTNNSTAKNILDDLANNIGGSSYFNINTTYYNGSNVHVLNQVGHAADVTVSGYPYGKNLSDSQIQQIVASTNPTDVNGVYFVLTSSDVTASSGFCTQYCGWHTHGTSNGVDIKSSFIGNPERCPSSCAAQTGSPNGNYGADGMASIISHELEEAVTDPDLNAWYDRRGYENADKCAWTFGTTWSSGGGIANVHLGSRDYLIQRNWVAASGGYCSMSY